MSTPWRDTLRRPLPVWLAAATLPVIPYLLIGDPRKRFIFAVLPTTVWAVWICVAAHEGGHLAAARLAGMRWLLWAAGPIKLRRTPSGLRAAINDRWHPLGYAVAVPGETTEPNRLRRPIAVMLAGGAAANLLVAILAALGVILLVGGLPDRAARRAFLQDPATALLFMFAVQLAVQGGMMGLINLIPIKEKGVMSDGARIGMLRRGGPESERWCALWAINAAVTAGTRPRDLDPALMAAVTARSDDSLDEGGAALMAYTAALDRGETDHAAGLLERAERIAETVPMLVPIVAAESAYFAARFRGDAARARARLADANGGMLDEPSRLRAEAATLLAEGRPAEARAQAEAALRALPESAVGQGTREAVADSLREIIADAEAHASGGARAPAPT